MRSTSLPETDDLVGGERIIEAVCCKPLDLLAEGEGEPDLRTGIRLNEPGDFLGFTDDFFLIIDSGSTEVVDDLVGVRKTPSAGRIGSNVGLVGVSSSDKSAGKCGGLKAAMVSSSTLSISNDCRSINFGGASVARRGPKGFLGRAGRSFTSGDALVGVVESGRRFSSSSSILTSSSVRRCS